jgi:hypothetical protein
MANNNVETITTIARPIRLLPLVVSDESLPTVCSRVGKVNHTATLPTLERERGN